MNIFEVIFRRVLLRGIGSALRFVFYLLAGKKVPFLKLHEGDANDFKNTLVGGLFLLVVALLIVKLLG